MNYLAIPLWHTSSYGYYIKDLVARAKADNAPIDAIYERDGKWATLSEVSNIDMLQSIKKRLKRDHGYPPDFVDIEALELIMIIDDRLQELSHHAARVEAGKAIAAQLVYTEMVELFDWILPEQYERLENLKAAYPEIWQRVNRDEAEEQVGI